MISMIHSYRPYFGHIYSPPSLVPRLTPPPINPTVDLIIKLAPPPPPHL